MSKSPAHRCCARAEDGPVGIARLWLLSCVVLSVASCARVERDGPVAEPPATVTTKTGFEMVLISAGTFQMGSDSGEADEAPVHTAYVSAFLMDRNEVTQASYAKVAQRNANLSNDPAKFKGEDRPVEMVSWADAALFCNQRSRDEGLEPCYDEETAECNFEASGYRLPTEAEWEYACRAGSTTSYCFGSDSSELARYAWYAGSASRRTHPVRQKKPNRWGLFDMHGNVAEWCTDIYDEAYYEVSPEKNPRGPSGGTKYVLRGGAWDGSAEACRSSARARSAPGFQDTCFARNNLGFRCVRKPPSATAGVAE